MALYNALRKFKMKRSTSRIDGCGLGVRPVMLGVVFNRCPSCTIELCLNQNHRHVGIFSKILCLWYTLAGLFVEIWADQYSAVQA